MARCEPQSAAHFPARHRQSDHRQNDIRDSIGRSPVHLDFVTARIRLSAVPVALNSLPELGRGHLLILVVVINEILRTNI
jgi:hypothetical protein